ncbi:hypothetical protein BHM03_00056132 [Ensete ventricosum]|nr:hypothetical protein BHM03_00056132 [Ensete ventricosum]
MEREEPLSSRLVVATTVVGAVAAGVGVQVLLPSTRRYYCCSNRSRCAGTTALYGAILLCAGKKNHVVVATAVSAGVPTSSAQKHTHTPPLSLTLHSLVHCRGMYHAPLGSPLLYLPKYSSYRERRAVVVVSRGRYSSAAPAHRATRLTALGRRFISPSSSSLLEPDVPQQGQCSSYGERGAVIVASHGRCNSVAPTHRATCLTACGRRSISPSSSSVPPPCLNPTFHDRDSAIVACANSLKLLEPLMRSKAAKQDEQKVEYSPRAEEAQSGAPTGKRSHKEKLITAETRLDVLEASLEELYQAKEGSLG